MELEPLNSLAYYANYVCTNKIITKLEELVRLERGWNGYSAIPVSMSNAIYALRIIEEICLESYLPEIVPGFDGDIQLEWHVNASIAELHIISPNNVYFWTNFGFPKGMEIHIQDCDFSLVKKILSEMFGIKS